ncbi:cap-specific mRNA (nucleoside-2'-O-)-methyltransferase 2-like isoform X1 [Dinothrombium tinctorium]|uniref:Cap-specific mRNA (nucleoside-2'-O-)-methyltransferase 2 n=1 Tax=Dinothrombium tinctorium TaxID=1965070 RepID=A0A3S3P5C4_9ACAR|nr:cap-specific mRNA (nucleoside-2'-O-)-methyltransferase 2-like isoform X1 [Dinothrombium tinctorium]RWS06254.1 cap-specific mRNA (nucleoside-2'-O-)-methyltransferase 2-like isoform X1 [Dinothrombium tinctorium]
MKSVSEWMMNEQKFEKYFEFNNNECGENTAFDVNLCFKESNWKIDELTTLKADLNAVQCLLNDKNIDEWGKHTAFTDRSAFLMNDAKKRLKCEPQFLTRAWLKFYEMLKNFNLVTKPASEVDQDNNTLYALYLCEAPGAFIAATNHFIKSNELNLKFVWIATSLNPYYEESDALGAAIVDDRFIRHPNSYRNWFFGEDNTGNILNKTFFASLKRRLAASKCDLIAADGGINCMDSPDQQEMLTFPLILCETLLALSNLKSEANFVVKCFSLFETHTLCLIYLLFTAFQKLIAYKPIASKEGNSELYFVCIGFKAAYREFVDLLTNVYFESPDENQTRRYIFSRAQISSDFITQFVDCAKFFQSRQRNAILKNFRLFQNIDQLAVSEITAMKKLISRYYIRKHHLEHIDPGDDLCPGVEHATVTVKNVFDFRHIRKCLKLDASYNERKYVAQSFAFNSSLNDALNAVYNCAQFERLFAWNSSSVSMHIDDFQFVYGSKYELVKCSKFCDISLLRLVYLYCSKHETLLTTESFDLSEKVRNTLRQLLNTFSAFHSSKIASLLNCANDKNTLCKFIENFFHSHRAVSLEKFASAEMQRNTLSQESERKVFVIDLNSMDANSFLPTFKSETNNAKQLVKCVLNLLPYLAANDLVIVHLNACLSRLVVGTLYSLTTIYKRFAFVPWYSSSNESSFHAKRLKVSIVGQLCLFTNENIEKNNFNEAKQLLSSLFEKIDAALQNQRNHYHLLEIISVPHLLSGNFTPSVFFLFTLMRFIFVDTSFTESLFQANVVHFLEKLKLAITQDKFSSQ